MEDSIITIIGTKKIKQKNSKYKIYSKDKAIERIRELLDEGYGYSIVQARK